MSVRPKQRLRGADRRGRRAPGAMGLGEAKLRAALRRWRPARRRATAPDAAGRSLPNTSSADTPTGGFGRWWPRLTASQAQALAGAAVTLAILLWEQIRQRLK